MMESQTIGKLAEALAKAQGEMQNAAKDKNNPFFKSSYADLASIWDACREPLSKNGLSVAQPLSMPEPGRLMLTTKLMHMSGEWIESQVPVVSVKSDPQSIGSAITYFRRFSLSALIGIAPAEVNEDDQDDDDDGNAASNRPLVQVKVNDPSSQIGAIITPQIGAEVKKIRALQAELGISDEEFKFELHKLFKASTMKGLSLDQLKIMTKFMETAKDGNPLDERRN